MFFHAYLNCRHLAETQTGVHTDEPIENLRQLKIKNSNMHELRQGMIDEFKFEIKLYNLTRAKNVTFFKIKDNWHRIEHYVRRM